MSTLVIFDLDGTLVDTEHRIAKIVSDLAQENGCPLDLKTAFYKYAGMSFKDRFNNIAQTYNKTFSPDLLQAIHTKYQAQKKEMYADPTLPLIKGAKELLERLSKNPNITLALATSNCTERARNVLEMTGISKYFGERVFGTDLTNGIKKPDPAIYNLALSGYSPESTLVIEDFLPGLQSAHAAGAYVINYFDPRMPDNSGIQEQLHREAGADTFVDDYDQFEEIITTAWKNWPQP